MQPIQPVSERFPALAEQEVLLTFCAPTAGVVQVAGTFNRWCQEANPLEHLASGEWAAPCSSDSSGRRSWHDCLWTPKVR